MCAPDLTGVTSSGDVAGRRRAAWEEDQEFETYDAMANSFSRDGHMLRQFSSSDVHRVKFSDWVPLPKSGAEERGSNRHEFGDRICTAKGNGIELERSLSRVAVSCRLGADFRVQIRLTVPFDEPENEPLTNSFKTWQAGTVMEVNTLLALSYSWSGERARRTSLGRRYIPHLRRRRQAL